ncbi:Holliday junction branch migration protein RuvA [Ancylothrix sp. C2]|uniref:Holliday junction branch migration protein RuvA n=1 Tax=Ancylothrix sp. D3o TaxID=2953691 RepID=UPI0021BA4A34|nr:Holliday junction branch migration protein RuvA [Ancylothrix sp. D3o]MCT7951098.1 Holliday junction branch migration protein RuvA [Ancylothrix sp. D3o]
MIAYLKGTVTQIQKTPPNKITLTLETNQIGYEIQIPPRLAEQIRTKTEQIQIFTHQQIREDQHILYGFASAAERDLFRQLISVSGIGPQSALGLLDTLGLETLVQAIVTGNIKALTKAPGVGNKTAERLSLELKTKLGESRKGAGLSVPVVLENSLQEDLEMTLLALGYTNTEVLRVLEALNQEPDLKQAGIEEWIRRAIAWLSRP